MVESNERMVAAQENLQKAIEEMAAAMDAADERWFPDDWMAIGCSRDIEDPNRTMYWRMYKDGSLPPHVALGLLKYSTVQLERVPWHSTEDDGDDD